MQDIALRERDASNGSRLNFGPVSGKTRSAPPISLLSRLDYGEYHYFPQSGKGLVAVTAAGLSPSEDHIIRIIALAIDGETYTDIQFEGLWLDNGGSLVPSPEQQEIIRPKAASDGISVPQDKAGQYSRQHLGTEQVPGDTGSSVRKSQHLSLLFRKTLEIVTDVPRATSFNNRSLGALQGWEEVIGDMYGVDHVRIMLDDMCLVSPCIGGSAQPASVKDAYFRRYCGKSPSNTYQRLTAILNSGPPGANSFARAWNFRSFTPDVLV
jgi:hypothetical protein